MIQRIEAVSATASPTPHRDRATPAGGAPRRAVDVGAVEDLLFPDPATAERDHPGGPGEDSASSSSSRPPTRTRSRTPSTARVRSSRTTPASGIPDRHRSRPRPLRRSPAARVPSLPPPLPDPVLAEKPGIAIVPRRAPAPLPAPLPGPRRGAAGDPEEGSADVPAVRLSPDRSRPRSHRRRRSPVPRSPRLRPERLRPPPRPPAGTGGDVSRGTSPAGGRSAAREGGLPSTLTSSCGRRTNWS